MSIKKEKTEHGKSVAVNSKNLLPLFYQKWLKKASIDELTDEREKLRIWRRQDEGDFGTTGLELLHVTISAITLELARRKNHARI